MDDIPRGFSRDLLNRIRSGLLRVESKYCDGIDVNVCLKESYDVYAGRLQEAGRTLDETLLTESIPAWVFQWAVARNWLPYPPLRPRRNNTAPTDRKYISSHEPVPEDELTVPFGCYKVTDWYKADVIKRLGSRISHWQAEALDPIAAGGLSKRKEALDKDREIRGERRDSPELSVDNAHDLPEIKKEALVILGAAFDALDDSTNPLRAIWSAVVGRESAGKWTLVPETDATYSVRIRLGYLAGQAVRALRRKSKRIPQLREHDPILARHERSQGNSDLVLGGVQDRWLRAWLELLRENSPEFKGSTGSGAIGRHKYTLHSGIIKNVCRASGNYCLQFASKFVQDHRAPKKPAMKAGHPTSRNVRSLRSRKTHRASSDNATDNSLTGVMNLAELPAKFQSSFEAAKAKAELKYATRAERFPHHPQFADPALHFPELIQDVFFAFCTEARNASRAGVWSVAQARKASDAALPVICDFYFVRECGSDSDAKKSRFRVTFTRTVVDDPQWKRHNSDLAELAERKSIPSGGAKKNRRFRGTKNGRPARAKLTAATSESRDLHAMVDAFLRRCNEQSKLKVNLIRKHICLAVGHKKPRQFQYWQAQSKKASKADDKNFRRILAMTPDEFVAVLSHKGILS
jgi:hypothetical protein